MDYQLNQHIHTFCSRGEARMGAGDHDVQEVVEAAVTGLWGALVAQVMPCSWMCVCEGGAVSVCV